MPPDFRATSELFWSSAGATALIDAVLVSLLVWRVIPVRFRTLKWPLVLSTALFWSGMWTFALRWGWTWNYRYIFPAWTYTLAPTFGLAFALLGLAFWWLALRLPGNPALSFCLLGGLEGFLSHVWAVYGLGATEKVPYLEGVSPWAVIGFAVFEMIFYWSLILVVAALLQGVWERLWRISSPNPGGW